MKANNFIKSYVHVYKVISISLVHFSLMKEVSSVNSKCLHMYEVLVLFLSKGTS